VLRRDVELETDRGGTIFCSHFLPRISEEKGSPVLPGKLPAVVYLHGNSSNRLEAGAVVGTVLAHGISLFCFDAAGCGLSDGDYVSLGWFEREDLAVVLRHLRALPNTGPVGLWGRSMGAVTALLHTDRDPQLSAICLDSPFANLRQLAEDLAQSKSGAFKVPAWLVDAGIAVVRMRVQALAGFDIEDVVPLDHARRCTVPAIFMHARQDTFISPAHSKQLYNAYGGQKQMINIEGDHNSERSQQAVNQAVGFFRRCFDNALRLASQVRAAPPLPVAAPTFGVPPATGLAMAPQGQRPGPSQFLYQGRGPAPCMMPMTPSFAGHLAGGCPGVSSPSWAPPLQHQQLPPAGQRPFPLPQQQPPLALPLVAGAPLPRQPPGLLPPGVQSPRAGGASQSMLAERGPSRLCGVQSAGGVIGGLATARGGSSSRSGSLVMPVVRGQSPPPQPQQLLGRAGDGHPLATPRQQSPRPRPGPAPAVACPSHVPKEPLATCASHAAVAPDYWRLASAGG